LVQYSKIAKALGPHEKVAFGLYRPEATKPYRYAPLTKRDAGILAEFLAEEVTYRGSIHGVIDTLGIAELWFHLRRAGGGLVRCEIPLSIYDEVAKACERRNALVYVHGSITARRVDREVSKVKVDGIRVAPRLTEDRYQSFFGADPGYGGELSSDQLIGRIRYGD
jgi:hypothetical protein